MGRRWTTNQYMNRYIRRMERRAFNRSWDNVHKPKSPDGTRKCANCAYDSTCDRPRHGNHMNCFRPFLPEESVPAMEKNRNAFDAEAQKTKSGARVAFVIFALLLTGFVYAFSSVAPGVITVILMILIFLAFIA